ncbi:MAG: hypothetical protein OSB46_17885, partial [Alphaproteobacteria bacterium]|nr:hypothetical protein [Alphaproteobacteria bacterium]
VYQPIHSALFSSSSRILSRITMGHKDSLAKQSVSKAVTGRTLQHFPARPWRCDVSAFVSGGVRGFF